MAVFRVEKNQNYTVMSNHHLRNPDLSLKAKGLLSQMLSLPEEWDYTLKGLSQINREGIDAIREAVRELERAGYVTRTRVRNEKGQLGAADYVIHEFPVPTKPTLENPTQDKPISENPTLENPMQENPTQLNKELSKKEKIMTDVSNNDQSIRRSRRTRRHSAGLTGLTETARLRFTGILSKTISNMTRYALNLTGNG